MNHTHRLVVLGDPHLLSSEYALWENEIIPDINALKPDRVVILGDLSGGAQTGSAEGTAEAVRRFAGFSAPWETIIGNHDLQHSDFATDEAAVAMMLHAIGRERPGWVVEEEEYAVIGLDNTFWRRNPISKNEIVISREQIDWWRATLKELGEKPVIMACHAPVIGSGVMTLPELHTWGGNTYANQSAHPGEILQVLYEHPNVVCWFSGHIHLGQHYRDAISRRLGVFFAHTGTASPESSRDGYRHSRVLDFGPQGIRLGSYDHCLRTMDATLEYTHPLPFPEVVRERRRDLDQRFVPRDPATMEQPSPALRRKGFRFFWISDAHSTAPLIPLQQRVARWATREALSVMPDAIILGGDITHRADPAQAQAFLAGFRPHRVPQYLIRGNNEGAGVGPLFGVHSIALSEPLPQAGQVWLLSAANPEEVGQGLDRYLQERDAAHPSLVFCHFPPEAAGEARLKALEESPAPVYWVCGHLHEALESRAGNLHRLVSAGADPVKARGSLPEAMVIDWDGEQPWVRRIPVAERFLNPSRQPVHFPGLASYGSGENLLRLVLEHRIRALQFRHGLVGGMPSEAERALARQYRCEVPGGFLSIHLPAFSRPEEGLDWENQSASLEYAREMRLDDLTIHLPNVTADRLYDPEGRLLETPWAAQCLETYTRLAAFALEMGAQISFENVYNKRVNPPGQELLGTQPWHLLRFVEAVRGRLAQQGVGPVERVGIIFDAGHAFADVHFSKHHGIGDWLMRLGPYLQLAHIHQVLKPGNHHPITHACGPYINFIGLIAAFRDAAPRPFPLLIEVRDPAQALASYHCLKATGLF